MTVILMVRETVLSSKLGDHARACQRGSRPMVHRREKSTGSGYLGGAGCAAGRDFARGYKIFRLEWPG